MNGKEFPKNGFEKFTAKFLVNKMKVNKDAALQNYAVAATDRQYNIWLRDPLAINVFSWEMAAQKLDYMHLNPLQPHWLYVPTRLIIGFHQLFFTNRMWMNLGCLSILGKYFNGRQVASGDIGHGNKRKAVFGEDTDHRRNGVLYI